MDAHVSKEGELLKNWINPFPLDLASQLTTVGMKESYCLAERFQKRFVWKTEKTKLVSYFWGFKHICLLKEVLGTMHLNVNDSLDHIYIFPSYHMTCICNK